jgi:hypothetical protein
MGELIEPNKKTVLDEQYMFLTLINMYVSEFHSKSFTLR